MARRGAGYEITALDVHTAYSHAMEAAEVLGQVEETRQRIEELVTTGRSPGGFVRQVLGHRFGIR